MTVKRIIKIITPILISLFFVAPGYSDLSVDDSRAAVKIDSLEVHSKMSGNSKVLKSLKKGDIVKVEVEVEGSGGIWCGIAEGGQSDVTGYVACGDLNRAVRKGKSWRMTESAIIHEGKKEPSGEKAFSKRPYSDIQAFLYMTSW